jgi:hypothetical protein
MAKISILIALVVLLLACNDSPPQWVVDSASSNCGGTDRIHQIFYDARVSSGSVTCKNGINYSITLQEDK